MIHNYQKIVVSGVQPTGTIHIGNYLGAFKNFLRLQKNYQCFFFIADLHSLTVPQKAEILQKNIIELMAVFLAVGLDPQRSVLFIQSHIPQHSELEWILSTLTPLSYLKEMHQFKEKAKKQGHDVNAGLFLYPVLQSADVLLYNADYVPVGKDQVQHVELIRDLAKRFNDRYGQIFEIPEALVMKNGAKIMSLQDPLKKMSKSDSEKSYIAIFDSPEQIKEKIKSAVTDSGSEIVFDPQNKPAISNLLTIASLLLNQDIETVAESFNGLNYSQFKEKLANIIIEYFASIREKKTKLIQHKEDLINIFAKGAKIAQDIALKKISQIKKILGLFN